jgi:hypothetical protein
MCTGVTWGVMALDLFLGRLEGMDKLCAPNQRNDHTTEITE